MNPTTEKIDAGDGKHFDAYVSVPDQPNGKAVIVVQEIFGVTPYIREVADRYARDGYLAVAPDLFWRIEPGMSLTHSKEDMQQAFAALEKFNEDLGVEDIGRAVAFAKARRGTSGGVAVVGMCLGGKLAWLAASRLSIDASLAFYGVGIEKNLADAASIKTPLLMFFGGNDKYVPQAVREKIAAATVGNPVVRMEVYEKADHGFYTRGDATVISSAHEKALAFLQQHMTQSGARP